MTDTPQRRTVRERGPNRFRTRPPGLPLLGSGAEPDGERTAAELIALARAARRAVADRAGQG